MIYCAYILLNIYYIKQSFTMSFLPDEISSHTLNEYLKQHRIKLADKKIIKPSHASLPGYYRPGMYYISPEENDELYRLIYHHCFIKNLPLHLTETHNDCEYTQYLDDVDLRKINVEFGEIQRQYERNDIIEYCKLSMKHLENHFELTDGQRYMYVFEKDKPSYCADKKVAKDGWHIMIPSLVAPFEEFRKVREARLNNNKIGEIFTKMNVMNPIRDIIDGCVIKKNNWFMYGSRKPNGSSYYVSYILNIKDNEVQILDQDDLGFNDQDLIKLFSLRNKKLNYTLKSTT